VGGGESEESDRQWERSSGRGKGRGIGYRGTEGGGGKGVVGDEDSWMVREEGQQMYFSGEIRIGDCVGGVRTNMRS